MKGTLRLLSLALVLLVCVNLVGAGPQHSAGAAERSAIVVFNGTLWDGTGSGPIPDAAVVIEDGRIRAAGPRVQIEIPDGAQRVDAAGGTIMPGVIDAHVHVMASLAAGNDVLTPWLLSGVTTIQDAGVAAAGGVEQTRNLLATVPARSPRVQLAGPIITAPDGYPEHRVYATLAREVADAGQARAAVQELTDHEAVDVIKVAIERGFDADYGDAGWPALSEDEVAAIVDEAHARGRPVYAHLTGPEELRVAAEAGVDVDAHAPVTPALDDALLVAVRANMTMITTIGCWMAERDGYSQVAAANAARYYQLGGRLAIGTDFPFAPASMPLTEFQYLSDAGVPNQDILLAATRNAAVAIGRSDELGTLEPGKIADLIVVDGDPLADWRAMANVPVVILAGDVVKAPESAGE